MLHRSYEVCDAAAAAAILDVATTAAAAATCGFVVWRVLLFFNMTFDYVEPWFIKITVSSSRNWSAR